MEIVTQGAFQRTDFKFPASSGRNLLFQAKITDGATDRFLTAWCVQCVRIWLWIRLLSNRLLSGCWSACIGTYKSALLSCSWLTERWYTRYSLRQFTELHRCNADECMIQYLFITNSYARKKIQSYTHTVKLQYNTSAGRRRNTFTCRCTVIRQSRGKLFNIKSISWVFHKPIWSHTNISLSIPV